MYGLNWNSLSKKELLGMSPELKLEAALRRFCLQKKGQLGYCNTGSHGGDSKELIVIMRDLELVK